MSTYGVGPRALGSTLSLVVIIVLVIIVTAIVIVTAIIVSAARARGYELVEMHRLGCGSILVDLLVGRGGRRVGRCDRGASDIGADSGSRLVAEQCAEVGAVGL